MADKDGKRGAEVASQRDDIAVPWLKEISLILAKRPCGLFLDIDGTISRIAPSPDEAQISKLCLQQLEVLVRRLELVAVISGRSAGDARDLVGVDGIVYVGNHGLDRHDGALTRRHPLAKKYLSIMSEAVAALQPELNLPGVILEEKGMTASIHYRRSPDGETAREMILQAIGRWGKAGELQVAEGRKVVELRPPVDVNKGSALLSLAKEHRLKGSMCLGDDRTDVDAFRAVRFLDQQPGHRGAAIGVLSKETPPGFQDECDFTLQGVVGVEDFLERLVGLTNESGKDEKPAPREGRIEG